MLLTRPGRLSRTMVDQHPTVSRRPPISVVVPSRNRIEMLSICLAALRADLDVDDEIVVADSASHDAAAVARVALRYGAKLVRSEWAGASRARNAGWERARHELVGFVDDDVIVRPGWADAIAAGFSSEHVAFVPWHFCILTRWPFSIRS